MLVMQTVILKSSGNEWMNDEYFSRIKLAQEIHERKAKKDRSFGFEAISLAAYTDEVSPERIQTYQFIINRQRKFDGAPSSSFDEHKKNKESIIDRLNYEDELISPESDVLESRINKNRFNEYNFLVNVAGKLKNTDIDSIDNDLEEAMLSANDLSEKWDCLLALNRYIGGVASQKKAHFQILHKPGSYLDKLELDQFGNIKSLAYRYSTKKFDSWLTKCCSIGASLFEINNYFRLPGEDKGKANIAILGGSKKDRVNTACKIQRELETRIPLIISKDAILMVPNKNEVSISASPILKLRPGAVEYTGIAIPIPGFAVEPDGIGLPLKTTEFKEGVANAFVYNKNKFDYVTYRSLGNSILIPGHRIDENLAKILVKETRHFMYDQGSLFTRTINDYRDSDKERDKAMLKPY